MQIRESSKKDIFDIEKVHMLAFGEEEGPVIVGLVHRLFKDETAEPIFSFVAEEDGEIVGHILFTNVLVSDNKISAQILAPMAVLPDYQDQGVGSMLIQEALKKLRKSNTELIFVLGYPKYYSKFGFLSDARSFGFKAPYPIDEKNKDAWMVQELKPGLIGQVKGKVKCAKVLDKEEYWRE